MTPEAIRIRDGMNPDKVDAINDRIGEAARNINASDDDLIAVACQMLGVLIARNGGVPRMMIPVAELIGVSVAIASENTP